MIYKEIVREYNKRIYLSILDGLIERYNKYLMIKLKEMLRGNISFEEYYLIWNKKKFDMIREWNYFNKIL
jgi:hypothetical protein